MRAMREQLQKGDRPLVRCAADGGQQHLTRGRPRVSLYELLAHTDARSCVS